MRLLGLKSDVTTGQPACPHSALATLNSRSEHSDMNMLTDVHHEKHLLADSVEFPAHQSLDIHCSLPAYCTKEAFPPYLY